MHRLLGLQALWLRLLQCNSVLEQVGHCVVVDLKERNPDLAGLLQLGLLKSRKDLIDDSLDDSLFRCLVHQRVFDLLKNLPALDLISTLLCLAIFSCIWRTVLGHLTSKDCRDIVTILKTAKIAGVLIGFTARSNNVLGIALHGVGLSCACGTVHEDSAVLTIQESVGQHFAFTLCKDSGLRRIFVQHFFETEYSPLFRVGYAAMLNSSMKHNFFMVSIFTRFIDDFKADGVFALWLNDGSDSCNYLDRHLLFLRRVLLDFFQLFQHTVHVPLIRSSWSSKHLFIDFSSRAIPAQLEFWTKHLSLQLVFL